MTLTFRVSTCLATIVAVFLTATLHADFVIDSKLGTAIVNDGGTPNVGSIVFQGTADPLQVAGAATIGTIGANTINLHIDLIGDLDGSTFDITATNLIPFPAEIFLPAGPAVQTGVADNTTVTFTVSNFGAGAPEFSTLLGGGNTVDLWRFDITTPDHFEQGIDNSQIVITVEGGAFPTTTQLDNIGSQESPFVQNPLYDIAFGGGTLAVTAVPEPSSFLFIGALAMFLAGRSRLTTLRRSRQEAV